MGGAGADVLCSAGGFCFIWLNEHLWNCLQDLHPISFPLPFCTFHLSVHGLSLFHVCVHGAAVVGWLSGPVRGEQHLGQPPTCSLQELCCIHSFLWQTCRYLFLRVTACTRARGAFALVQSAGEGAAAPLLWAQ